MAKPCGAKTRAGGRCAKPGMNNGRCRLHGGLTPKHNKNAAKPGSIYSAFLTPEEREMEAGLELGNVDAELRLMRFRLRRALAAETDTPELEETIDRDLIGNEGASHEEKFKRRDYAGLIDRTVARIESLERRRLELLLMQKELDGEGAAAAHDVVGFEVIPYDDEPGDAAL